MTEQRRIPQWVKNEEEHKRIKDKIKLIEYQIAMFKRERNFQQKKYDNLVEKTEMRKVAYHMVYETRQQVDDAYLVGAIDDQEYMRCRSVIWQVYSDRGYIARLKWLDDMIAYYENQLEQINKWRDERRKQTYDNYRKKQRHYAYKRRHRREMKKEALRRRWKEHGIG